jgi:SM-20-related protein
MVREPIWWHGKVSTPRQQFGFWSAYGMPSVGPRESCFSGLSKNRVFAPVFELWKRLIAGPLQAHELLRVYANAHTFGVEGFVHRDSQNRKNDWTSVYFAHPKWNINWGGELIFLHDTKDEIIQAVYPRPGRLVIFPGALRHCARSVSRECAELRVSIVFKSHRVARP